MKTLTTTLLFGVALASAHAQYEIGYPPLGYNQGTIPIYLNTVTDPGFELTHTPWDQSESYYEDSDGDKTYEPLGSRTRTAHAGKYGFNMGIQRQSYTPFLVSILKQTLMYPMNTNVLQEASVWVNTEEQVITVTLWYSDGTASHKTKTLTDSNASASQNYFKKWNFTSIVEPNKFITAIEFDVTSSDGEGCILDDVSLIGLYYI